MSSMAEYVRLAQLHGLSVSGVRYRLRTGKPLDSKRSQHRAHKTHGTGPVARCLDCAGAFAPVSKFNRICPVCRGMEIHKAKLAETA